MKYIHTCEKHEKTEVTSFHSGSQFITEPADQEEINLLRLPREPDAIYWHGGVMPQRYTVVPFFNEKKSNFVQIKNRYIQIHIYGGVSLFS